MAIVGYVGYTFIKDHRMRGLVGYASLYARDVETRMNAYFNDHGESPPDLQAAGIPHVKQSVYWDTGKKLAFRITLRQDIMTFEFTDAPSAIVGKTLIFKATVSDKQVRWSCIGGTVNVSHQPPGCRH